MKRVLRCITVIMTAVCLLTGLIAVLPGMNMEVYAAPPSKMQFAEAKELVDFKLEQDEEIGRIKFGAEGREWLIAGEDSDEDIAEGTGVGLALLSASSFDDSIYGLNNEYMDSLIKKGLEDCLDDVFSTEEQEKMKEVTIKAQNLSMQATMAAELYIPDVNFQEAGGLGKEINLGAQYDINVSLDFLNGIYEFEKGNNFWLRSSKVVSNNIASRVGPDAQIEESVVSNFNAVVPVFNLDLQSVLFASTAPVSSEGTLTIDNAFILRYEGNSLGSAVLNRAKKRVAISGVGSNETYLVVQNSSGAWAKKVHENVSVSANEVTIGGAPLTSFADCKVWLETTDAGRITTATMATQLDTADVSVAAGAHMTRTADSGAEVQTGLKTAMKDVVYIADKGYYFPQDYNHDKSMDKNDITVVRNSNTQVTVTGTPAENTDIKLADAIKKKIPETPKVDGGVEHITGTTPDMEYAASETASLTEWKACTDGTTAVAPGIWYVRYRETGEQETGPATQVTVVAAVQAMKAAPDQITFASVNAGYAQPEAQSVTITNTGNGPITLIQPVSSSGNYTIGELSKINLAANETATFTVRPNTKLAVGTYDETIEMNTKEGISASVKTSFRVVEKEVKTPVKKTEAKSTTPKTGDENHTLLWLAILVLSAGGAIIIGVVKKRKRIR